MTRFLGAVLVLLLCSSLSAQTRVDAGLGLGRQSFESPNIGSRLAISPELMLSRGPLAAYYSLDLVDLGSPAGSMYASHFGAAYRWPLGRNFAVRVGAGPSYVTIDRLGGELAWHAQAEVGWRMRRLEWFARVRHFDHGLSDDRVTNGRPDGPVVAGGVRVMLWD